jgi:hypothetical protein
VALFLVNSTNSGNYHHILRSALSVDFPFFEPHWELSPLTFCEHPHIPCKKSKLSLIGFAKYIDRTHKFQPLPLEPEPIFAFVCQGCGVQKGLCKEECSLYTEEIIGYKVYRLGPGSTRLPHYSGQERGLQHTQTWLLFLQGLEKGTRRHQESTE